MIDRLLAAGSVRRAHDERDRRRVIITAVAERLAEIAPHYEPLATEFHKATGDYTSDELGLILGFFDRMHEIHIRTTAQLRSGDANS